MRQKGSRKYRSAVSGRVSPECSYHNGWKIPFLPQFTEGLSKWANKIFLKMLQWRYKLTGMMFDSCSVSFLSLPLKGSTHWMGSWMGKCLFRKNNTSSVSGKSQSLSSWLSPDPVCRDTFHCLCLSGSSLRFSWQQCCGRAWCGW